MGKRKRNRIRRSNGAQPSLPPVRPGMQSPRRSVPLDIPRPPYALTGDPGPSVLPLVRTPDEIESMRFNPWRLTHGIEPSEDPLLRTRRDAYDIGSEWRLAARAGGPQPGQACPFSGG